MLERKIRSAVLVAGLALVPGRLIAASGGVEYHLFGGWAYGKTDGNAFLEADEDGNYENAQLALAASAEPMERLRLAGQFEVRASGEEEETEVELDYAFAEWSFSDTARFRIGRIKHAFGIYAEVFDVGTVRPFYDLPAAIYGTGGIAAENVDGAALAGSFVLSAGWGLDYTAYFGGLRTEVSEPWDVLRLQAAEPGELVGMDDEEGFVEPSHVDDVLGFQLLFDTPGRALSFGVSAYSGSVEREELFATETGDDEQAETHRHVAWDAHVEWLSEPWLVRAEVASLDAEDEIRVEAAYLELAYHLTEHWQLATRFDWAESHVEEVDLGTLPSLAEHRDLALGVNYWFSPNFVVKLAWHRVQGNRFALPENAVEAILGDALDDETQLVQLGGQFSF
ncbi:MAG: hypothetical protein HC897_18160 [Thermoanaerobaculia bacterium]|nr:hypothetical protein [Thermoanaerobaculia bacterium]